MYILHTSHQTMKKHKMSYSCTNRQPKEEIPNYTDKFYSRDGDNTIDQASDFNKLCVDIHTDPKDKENWLYKVKDVLIKIKFDNTYQENTNLL